MYNTYKTVHIFGGKYFVSIRAQLHFLETSFFKKAVNKTYSYLLHQPSSYKQIMELKVDGGSTPKKPEVSKLWGMNQTWVRLGLRECISLCKLFPFLSVH